jgi:Protein of unknown function (DUF3072)
VSRVTSGKPLPMARNKDKDVKTRDDHAGDEAQAPGRDPDKPMSDTQRTYLEPLADSQDEEVQDDMSEADAARTIDRLQDNAVHVY